MMIYKDIKRENRIKFESENCIISLSSLAQLSHSLKLYNCLIDSPTQLPTNITTKVKKKHTDKVSTWYVLTESTESFTLNFQRKSSARNDVRERAIHPHTDNIQQKAMAYSRYSMLERNERRRSKNKKKLFSI